MSSAWFGRIPLAAAAGAVFCCSLWSADYRLDVRLDPKSKIVSGTVAVNWTNRTTRPAHDLRFHLYFNAWRDKNTSFFDSPRWRDRELDDWRDGEWGGTDIESLTLITPLAGGDPAAPREEHQDLMQKLEYIQPDDGNPHDKTVLRVPLPQPAPPGQRLRIEMRFATKVPRTFTRTGYRGDYFFLAHWFPKLGVFEADGTWNCHQFIQTEFYSEFGAYDVKIQVPAGWVLGATGRLEERRDNGDGTITYHHLQDRVHAFSWVASPHFREFNRTFAHPRLRPVEMRLLLMPDHKGQQDRYFAATEASLRYYGEWFGEYPYSQVTVVDPAYQSRTGGMEYPTFFTGGTRWLQPQGSGSPEGVTVHEAGHQFWYGLVANNEFEDAWLDEGFNTYSTRRTKLKAFPDEFLVERYLDGFFPVIFRDLPDSPRSVAGLSGLDSDLKKDRMSRPSWQQGPDAYGINSYGKPAMMLLTLERFLGWETFQKIMSTYFERWKFKHPKPQDFFDVASEVSGQNLDWFWSQTFHDSLLFDYAVDWVGETRREQPAFIVRRRGEGVFPIEIRVLFEDGEERMETWDGRERWKEFRYPEGNLIASVEADPQERLALDVERTNNSWHRDAPTGLAAKKWSFKWMVWLQNLMEQFAFHM